MDKDYFKVDGHQTCEIFRQACFRQQLMAHKIWRGNSMGRVSQVFSALRSPRYWAWLPGVLAAPTNLLFEGGNTSKDSVFS